MEPQTLTSREGTAPQTPQPVLQNSFNTVPRPVEQSTFNRSVAGIFAPIYILAGVLDIILYVVMWKIAEKYLPPGTAVNGYGIWCGIAWIIVGAVGIAACCVNTKSIYTACQVSYGIAAALAMTQTVLAGRGASGFDPYRNYIEQCREAVCNDAKVAYALVVTLAVLGAFILLAPTSVTVATVNQQQNQQFPVQNAGYDQPYNTGMQYYNPETPGYYPPPQPQQPYPEPPAYEQPSVPDYSDHKKASDVRGFP